MTLTIKVVNATDTAASETISPGTFAIGVNLSGMEYGVAGAVQNVNYVVPTLSELQYYKSQGLDLIRLPISWETLQTRLDGPLTASYLANIKSVLANAASLGMKVIIDLHNFGSYDGEKIGTAGVTDAEFANLWKQLSAAVTGSPGLAGYDLMNEPNNMPSATAWTSAAQAAITAIRTEDSASAIYVEGNDYASAYDWSSINPGFSTLVDPSHNLVFSAHVYLDTDDSGTHFDWAQQAAAGVTTQTGVDRLENFVAWLKEYNLKGDIGEIGVGNDSSSWLTALDNTLAYAKANNLQTTYWAGGAWWGSYPMSVEPQNGGSAPQIAVLDKYSGAYATVRTVKLSGTATPDSTVYLTDNGILLGSIRVGASGEASGTVTGRENGLQTFVVSTAAPGADGTIAAVTVDLAAPAGAEATLDVAITPATVKAETGSSAAMRFLSLKTSESSGKRAVSASTPPASGDAWREFLADHPSTAAFLQEFVHTGGALAGSMGSIAFGWADQISLPGGIAFLAAGIVGQI